MISTLTIMYKLEISCIVILSAIQIENNGSLCWQSGELQRNCNRHTRNKKNFNSLNITWCHLTFLPVYPGGPGKPGLPLNPYGMNKICYCTDKTHLLCREKNIFGRTSCFLSSKIMIVTIKGRKG